MNNNESKIMNLMLNWPENQLITQKWLDSINISRQLANKYAKTGWIEKIDRGLYKKKNTKIYWESLVARLQNDNILQTHLGANTAIDIHSLNHYISMGDNYHLWLYKDEETNKNLPSWFQKSLDSNCTLHFMKRKLFDCEIKKSLQTKLVENQNLLVSTKERAILELLSLCPQHYSLEYCMFIMENMLSLNPSLLQKLLESCNSDKVKKLFFLLAEHEDHAWFKRLNKSKISFKRNKVIVEENKHYYKKYNISTSIQFTIKKE